MPEPIVIVGCGGHGREIFGIIAAINDSGGDVWKVAGFLDDAPSEAGLRGVERLGSVWLGPCGRLAGLDARYVIGIGDPRIRAGAADRLGPLGTPASPLVHPAATVGLDNDMADGVVVFAGARITTNVTLGPHVHVNQNATVGHDAVLAAFVQVNPLAAVSGSCVLGRAVLVGTNAAILQGRSVGDGSTVGAGACVVRDVGAERIVKGVPAR
ncbi:NeuD/PglB/VioB family sugar acetyltransferase [Actinoplanes sp. NPDC049802]|uniref:NeuD/PglB/VioB family sugar acetyltransferase n=1 Tax=Actinoplanes sp. NPDC049802 TaxID=3154742 RepID=UPI0034064B4F